ncbi:MAG TPA: M protein [Mycobacterium sp.]|nr:M protein [Mycobacterium sp.]
MGTDDPGGPHPEGQAHSSASFEVERLSHQFDAHYAAGSTNDIRSLVPRAGSRIAALTDQLNKSQANLESTSARFSELASAIPGDIANLSDRLSGILTGAMAEADDIRAEARRFAQDIQSSAEKQAAAILSEAKAERQSVTELRSELETQQKEIEVYAARLREQAIWSAVEIMKDAETQAVEILTQMNSSINTHITEAQARLNELMEARSRISDRVRNALPSTTNPATAPE